MNRQLRQAKIDLLQSNYRHATTEKIRQVEMSFPRSRCLAH